MTALLEAIDDKAQQIGAQRVLDRLAGDPLPRISGSMALIAERGQPTRDAAASGLFQDAGLGSPPDSSGGRWPGAEITAPP